MANNHPVIVIMGALRAVFDGLRLMECQGKDSVLTVAEQVLHFPRNQVLDHLGRVAVAAACCLLDVLLQAT